MQTKHFYYLINFVSVVAGANLFYHKDSCDLTSNCLLLLTNVITCGINLYAKNYLTAIFSLIITIGLLYILIKY